jgi:acid phosphatase class B
MFLISHRGNINGANPIEENSINYILKAINLGFNVEIDVWFIDNSFYLGHDKPQYKIDHDFLTNEKLWCHAKNINALIEMSKYSIHYFWHDKDEFTLTSKNYIWAYPCKNINKNTIVVLPEIHNIDTSGCKGVCSDYIIKYAK